MPRTHFRSKPDLLFSPGFCGLPAFLLSVSHFSVPPANLPLSSVQSLSRVRLCHAMNRSMPGLPVHHQLPESTQTHVHRVGDANQPSHPLLSPSPALNLSQHQGQTCLHLAPNLPLKEAFPENKQAAFDIMENSPFLSSVPFQSSCLILLLPLNYKLWISSYLRCPTKVRSALNSL